MVKGAGRYKAYPRRLKGLYEWIGEELPRNGTDRSKRTCHILLKVDPLTHPRYATDSSMRYSNV